MKKNKSNRSIRFDPDDLARAKDFKIDVSKLAREALKREIFVASKICPYCDRVTSGFIQTSEPKVEK